MNSIELFFELMDYDFIIYAIKKKNIKVNGFMNINKAPKSLLRNVIKARYCSEERFYELLEDTFYESAKEYKGTSLEDFLSEFYLSPKKLNLTTFEMYGIFICLFPKEAEKYYEKIWANVENNKHIFSGFIDEDRDINEENCISIIEKYVQVKDDDDFIEKQVESLEEILDRLDETENYKSLKDIVESCTLPDMCRLAGDLSTVFNENIIWLAYITHNIDSIKKNTQQYEFFKKLLLNIALYINNELLIYKKERIESLLEACTTKDKEIQSSCKEKSDLCKSIKVLEDEVACYKEKVTILEDKVMQNISNSLKEWDPDTIVITNFAPDRIMDSIGNYKIIKPNMIEENKDILKGFKGTVFIDRGSISSTRSLLKLEDYLENNKIKKITVFAKSIEELAKNIIISKFTMEG
ncbi:MAG: hypothetical protein RR840_00810 [Clostridium sp.]